MAPIFKENHSIATQVLLQQQNTCQLHVPWASKNPDLNVIVDLLDELNWRVRRQPEAPRNNQELQQSLLQEWGRIPQAFVQTYVLSRDRGVTKSLELKVFTPGISWAKLCHVAGSMYSMVT